MLTVTCPSCKNSFEVHDSRQGEKGACPSCKQRLQIPFAPRSKTVLAAFESQAPDPPPQAVLADSIPSVLPVRTISIPFIVAAILLFLYGGLVLVTNCGG